jgi:hypothetical protein
MGAGRGLAIIGAIFGILSVLLSMVLPKIFCWYTMGTDLTVPELHFYLTGFGTLVSKIETDIAVWVCIGGILVIIGSVVCVFSTIVKNRKIGAIGGILMLVGPLLIFVEILFDNSDFAEIVNDFVDLSNGNIFYGSYEDMTSHYALWNVWIGFYIAIGGAILGLIGGLIIER